MTYEFFVVEMTITNFRKQNAPKMEINYVKLEIKIFFSNGTRFVFKELHHTAVIHQFS